MGHGGHAIAVREAERERQASGEQRTAPDRLSKEFGKFLDDFDNEVERIRFCEREESWEKLGHQLADELIKAVEAEQKRGYSAYAEE